MAILDPQNILAEIQDQIEAASFDLGKGLVMLKDGTEPDNSDARVTLLAQAFQRSLTALAMMVLSA